MSDQSGKWFSKMFKKKSQPKPDWDPDASPRATTRKDLQPRGVYNKGDFIGHGYEVLGVLGKGGFGVVYQVFSHELGNVYALKTFLDEFVADQQVRNRFHKEASVWVELGQHPYLVRAHVVDEVSGRLYILMEFIAPNEQGLNSLEAYLQRRPPDLTQSLRWAIQVCHGMEYAYLKGVRAHRDLKPANIMIDKDRNAKISDFGLAGVVSESRATNTAALGTLFGQTMAGAGFGTPTHMPPEQFVNAAGCDERSDIYSFGVVLYQMASGGRLPFPVPVGADWQMMQRLHQQSPVPYLDSPLFPFIRLCLEKSPEKRYPTFKELRKDLEPLLQRLTGETIPMPQVEELEEWEWTNKGTSLNNLGRYEEAIRCFDKALELDKDYVIAWNNRGTSFNNLGRSDEAIGCYDRALVLDQRDVAAWSNKGNSLDSLDRFEEAIYCFDKALDLDPRHAGVWANKGSCLNSLSRYKEAIDCLDKALELDPRNEIAWSNKGNSLTRLEQNEEAIRCYDHALEIDPGHVAAWANKGGSLFALGQPEEALRCYEQALELDPRDTTAWYNKGIRLGSLGNYEDAIHCFDKTLEFDPQHTGTWYAKALAEDILCRWDQAAYSFKQFLAFASAQDDEKIKNARKRLLELECS